MMEGFMYFLVYKIQKGIFLVGNVVRYLYIPRIASNFIKYVVSEI